MFNTEARDKVRCGNPGRYRRNTIFEWTAFNERPHDIVIVKVTSQLLGKKLQYHEHRLRLVYLNHRKKLDKSHFSVTSGANILLNFIKLNKS